jgi:hypothetical protein
VEGVGEGVTTCKKDSPSSSILWSLFEKMVLTDGRTDGRGYRTECEEADLRLLMTLAFYFSCISISVVFFFSGNERSFVMGSLVKSQWLLYIPPVLTLFYVLPTLCIMRFVWI